MVCNSNSITEDAVVPFKHSTTNNLLISIHKENPTRSNNVSEFLSFHIYTKLNMFQQPSMNEKPEAASAVLGS
jgi:hypothetical protein